MTQILVTEDDLDVLNLVAHQLRIRNYDVVAVEAPGQALRLIHSGLRPDAAVLDVMMPTMSGFKLLRQLRQYGGLEEMPVVFISARTQAEDIVAGEALGATYITKPFLSGDLADALADALAEAAAEAASEDTAEADQAGPGMLGPTTGAHRSEAMVGLPQSGRNRPAGGTGSSRA